MRISTYLSVGAVCACGLAMAQNPSDAPSDPASSQPADISDAYSEAPSEATAPRRRFMSLDELSLEAGFDAEMQRRVVRTNAMGFDRPRLGQTNKEYRFQETLGLNGRGSIIDERVLTYETMVRWGLSQEHFTEYGNGGPFFDKSKSPDGTVLEYDIRLQAFPAGKVSATGYASQLDDRIPLPFLPSLQRRSEKYGAGIFYNDPKLPMRLTFDHLFDRIESGQNWYYQDNEQQGDDSLRYEATWQPTDTHSLNLEYEYERESDQYSGTADRFDTTRNYFGLTDVIQFGLDNRSRLDTVLQLENERGDIPRDIYQFTPQLRLQHTDSLFTIYKAQLLKQNYFELETKTGRLDWGITHQFEDLLTSSLGLYGFKQDSNDNADLTEGGALANFVLTKKNDSGIFSANLSLMHSQTDSSNAGRSGIVIDESVTFRDPLPATLAQRNVNQITIIVRDPIGLRIYRPGLDYQVIRLKDYSALVRVPNGLIRDLQTVLVSYTYDVFKNFHVTRDRIDLRIQQDFQMGLTPYYAMSWQDEKIDPQQYLVFEDENINRQRVGFTYRQPRWSAGPEYEYNDDSIDPYQALHLNGDVVVLQDEKQQLNGRAASSFFRFYGTDYLEKRNTTLIDLGMTYRYALGQNLEANATAMYRFQNDSLFGRTNGVDLSSSLSYRIGLFTILLETEYDMLDLPGSTDNSVTFWLKVRREIPVIRRPRE